MPRFTVRHSTSLVSLYASPFSANLGAASQSVSSHLGNDCSMSATSCRAKTVSHSHIHERPGTYQGTGALPFPADQFPASIT